MLMTGGVKRMREQYSSSDESSGSNRPMRVPRWSFEMPHRYSPTRSVDEASESVYSFQEFETEFVQTTSDTCSKSDVDSYAAGEELELATSSSEQDKSDGSTSTDLANTYFELMPLTKDDPGLLAGSSHSDDSTDAAGRDPEVPKGDYWTCALCKNSNNNPVYRYCEKCFQVRKSYFPPRPRPKEKKRKKRPKNSLEAALLRAGKLGKTESEELTSDEEKTKSRKVPAATSSQDSASVASTSFNTQESVRSTTTDSGVSQISTDTMDVLCNSCDARPKDGVFVHNNTGHNWCCYKCAKKIWKRTNRCPVCNRTVMKVIKIFKD